MIKMNRMQVEAVCTKIKNTAKAQIAKERKEFLKSWKPTKEQQEELSAFAKMEHLAEEFNKKYMSEGRELIVGHYGRYSNSKKLKQEMFNDYVEERLTHFNFSNLESDIIIATLEVSTIDELIEQSLNKYKL